MKYRTLGRTGFKVSEIGLGGEYLEGKPLKQVCNTVDAAMDAGINLLDCFMSNPDIRSDLGTALKGKRDKMYIQGHFRSIWKNGQYGRTMDAGREGHILMAKTVLIVEDDRNIADLLRLYLEKEGYTVVIAPDGMRGVEQFRTVHPSLVLLDVMLPGLDGWGVCRAIRAESQTPIIMLTAKSETEDKVNGLKQGADDYITKPFEMKEVLARIEAVLRRSGIEPEKSRRRLEFDKLVIDMDAFELTVDGKKVPTPPKEMELLYHLASTPNRVYTRNQLLDEVWGFDYFGDTRTVDVHIKRLREKLEGVSDQWDLKTVWSVGYKFEVK